MSIKNRLFAKNGHDCTIPTGLEDLPMFRPSSNIVVQIKNLLIRYRMASELNFRCQTFLRSQKHVDLEHRKHVKNLFIIHPFSDFRKNWEIFMMIVLLIQFIMIPLDVCFYKVDMVHNCTEGFVWNIIRLLADCICLVDVVITFFTGYCDYKKNVVILEPKAICIHYLITFFVPDLLSSIPTDFEIFFYIDDNNNYIALPAYLSVLRLLRIFSFLRYCKQLLQTYKVDYAIYKITMILTIYMLYFHVLCCLTIFIVTRNTTNEFHASMYNASRTDMPYNLLYDVETTYFYIFYETARLVNNSGHLWLTSEMRIYAVIIWITSRLIYMYLTALIIDVIISKTSAVQKYFEAVSEMKDFMSHKKLPMHLQRRLLQYYEYRFQNTYFREQEILNTISGQLKQEVVMHRCSKLVENVDFFKDLPLSLLLRIVSGLRQEYFMANDVVIKVNTVGDCMFFIGSGTVAIYTRLGQEICHLGDGEHFGEIALISRDELRTAAVIAVETSELYRLDRAEFLRAIMPYPDLLMKIQYIAQERMDATKELNDRAESSKSNIINNRHTSQQKL